MRWLLGEVGVKRMNPFYQRLFGGPSKCGRCGRSVPHDHEETCWYCQGPLCFGCWEEHGHCGHPEADEMNERMRAHYRRQEGE